MHAHAMGLTALCSLLTGCVHRDNIKEMRRTHFDVGYDEIDWDDTTHKGSFHRHPFLQMKVCAMGWGGQL